jgi:hypothetical protein
MELLQLHVLTHKLMPIVQHEAQPTLWLGGYESNGEWFRRLLARQTGYHPSGT